MNTPAAFPVAMVHRVVEAMRATRCARLKAITGKDVVLNDAKTTSELQGEAYDILAAVFAPDEATVVAAIKIFKDAGQRRIDEIGHEPEDEEEAEEIVSVALQALVNADMLHVAPVTPEGNRLDDFFAKELERQIPLPIGD